jgi:cytochrome c oxidase cbb3-type subunit III
MNSLTSYLVIAVVLLNIAGCFWLLRWTATKRTVKPKHGDSAAQTAAAEDVGVQTTGHVWDGDLTEYNNPLPRWWLNMFYLSIAFAIAYMLLYPGLGNWSGYFRWTSTHEHDVQARAARETYLAAFTPFRALSVAQLSTNSDAQRMGQSIFNNSCAACHGSDARGAKGFPNLTDADWLYGGDEVAIGLTLREGRNAVMPGWQAVAGDAGISELVAYVRQLAGAPPTAAATAGKARFEQLCIACHGAEGKGNQAMGAPNLTDAIWLYGGDTATLTETLKNGRGGVMPAQKWLLNEDQIRVMTAWVLAQNGNAQAGSSGPQ